MQGASSELRILGRYVGIALASSLLLLGFISFKSINQYSNKCKNIAITIGNASYSLYLIHWVILINAGRGKYKLMLGAPDWAAELWRFSWISICIIAAIAMYYFIEKPIIKLGETCLSYLKGSAPKSLA